MYNMMIDVQNWTNVTWGKCNCQPKTQRPKDDDHEQLVRTRRSYAQPRRAMVMLQIWCVKSTILLSLEQCSKRVTWLYDIVCIGCPYSRCQNASDPDPHHPNPIGMDVRWMIHTHPYPIFDSNPRNYMILHVTI